MYLARLAGGVLIGIGVVWSIQGDPDGLLILAAGLLAFLFDHT